MLLIVQHHSFAGQELMLQQHCDSQDAECGYEQEKEQQLGLPDGW